MSKLSRVLIPALFVGQGLFLGATFNTMFAALVGLGICAGFAFLTNRALVRKERMEAQSLPMSRWESTRRARVAVAMFLLALMVVGWRFIYHVGQTLNPIAFAVDGLAHVCFALGLVMLVLHPKFGHPSMLGLGMLVVMLSVAAGGASQSISAQVAVALVAGVGYLFASRSILNHWAIHHPRHGREQGGHDLKAKPLQPEGHSVDRRRIGFLFSLIVVSVFVLSTSALAHATSLLLPEVQKVVFDKLKSTFDVVSKDNVVSGGRYVRGGRLGSIRYRNVTNAQEVALECYADVAPGYLRGTVFDWYANSVWREFDNVPSYTRPEVESFRPRNIGASEPGSAAIRGPEKGTLVRFGVHPTDGKRVATVEIKNDPIKGHVFFAPLEMRWIEAKGRTVSVSSHDVIEHGINTRLPYIVGVSMDSRREPMDEERREVLTLVSSNMSEELRRLTESVTVDCKTTREKAEAIRRLFASTYLYSLESTPTPSNVEPLLYFLRTKHPAHCEYFASATVLMLRSVGVPARYVTGYVSMEASADEKGMWVARNRDAHAWAEAYDDATMTWFPVESTPGRTYSTIGMDSEADALLADQFDENQLATSESDTLVGRFTGWLLSMRATDPLSLLIRFGQVPLFLFAAFFLWRRLRGEQQGELNPEDLLSKKLLVRVDRRVKKHDLVRQPHETMHQFASRIETELEELAAGGRVDTKHELLGRCADWYRSFAEARYQGEVPEPFEV